MGILEFLKDLFSFEIRTTGTTTVLNTRKSLDEASIRLNSQYREVARWTSAGAGLLLGDWHTVPPNKLWLISAITTQGVLAAGSYGSFDITDGNRVVSGYQVAAQGNIARQTHLVDNSIGESPITLRPGEQIRAVLYTGGALAGLPCNMRYYEVDI